MKIAEIKRENMACSPKGLTSQHSLESPSQQPSISPSLNDLSPVGTTTNSHGWTHRRRKLLSHIWKEFEPIYQGIKLVKGHCLHCKEVFPASRDSGSSHIGRHLKYDLLDYLLRDFVNEEEAGKWMGEVNKTMQMLFDKYNLEVSAHSQREMGIPNAEEVEEEDDPLAEWDKHMRSKRRQSKNEIDHYLKEELLPRKKKVDILEWWKLNSSKYPVLSKMARDILAIPTSTVPSESSFSTGGRVINDYWSSLSCDSVDMLICLEDWFKAAEALDSEQLA